MTADRSGRLLTTLLAWALPVLTAGAGGWEARFGSPPDWAGYEGPETVEFAGGALVVEGRRGPGEHWEADPGSCVLATVFDAVDGIEHEGTGAWLELETSVDHAPRRPQGSAWGAELADWHHAASFWLVRSGSREGAVLVSGGQRTPLIPAEVARTRRWLLVADEHGAHLSVDGELLASLPLAPRGRPGPPFVRFGTGRGSVSASLTSLGHGCLQPLDTLVETGGGEERGVTILGHEGFRPALAIEPGSLLLNGRPAEAWTEGDFDGDGLLDLRAAPAGELGGPVAVDARDAEGRRLRGWSAR